LVISPYARRNFVGHEQFDHTSILKMIEWRFGLPPLTIRDQTANNLADVLDLGSPDVSAPTFNVPTGPFGRACLPGTINPIATTRASVLQKLRTRAVKAGFYGVR
jgi:phospholipase C